MRHLMSLYLKIDVLPGTNILEACRDMCELADRMGCNVESRFNGVMLIAYPGSSAEVMVRRYHKSLDGGEPHMPVSSR